MQRTVRTILVSVLVLLMSFNPAAAWHHWGGGYRGGYSGGYGGDRGNYYSGCQSYGPAYSSCYGGSSNCGSHGYGFERVVYSSEPYCGGCDGGCNSCGGCDSCGSSYSYGGCNSCGSSSCDGCGGASSCDDCGPGGAIIESTPQVYQETAPTPPPSETHIMPTPPATVHKPMSTTPAPTLPPEPAPMPAGPNPATPIETTDPLFGGEPESTAPAAETPKTPAEAPADDSLFGPSPTEPATPTPSETPAEQPSDDFFGTESEPATETPASETPATGGAAEEPAADSLFDEPAGTGTSGSPEEKPAEDSATPASDPLDMFGPQSDAAPAEGTPPRTENSTSPRKRATFGAAESVLSEPGGLASSEMRTWVDNTGRYSCQGRLERFVDGNVRLMKDNGRTTTVPMNRLSANDLAFVNRQASAQPQTTFAQAGSSGAAITLTAN